MLEPKEHGVTVTRTGIARGNLIELDRAVDLPIGTPVAVEVRAVTAEADRHPLPPAELARFLRATPRVTPADAAALMTQIEESRLPADYRGIFDDLPR